MTSALFHQVRVGSPIRKQALSVFPLFSASADPGINYLLSSQAIAEGAVTVEEISERGSVPELMVKNLGDSPVLFLEGEELRGAKQNRVLNTTVLIAAGSETKIPVSCVESGRWRYRSKQFSASESHASPRLRRLLKLTVTRALISGSGHHSDQGAVWNEVSRQMSAHGSESTTSAMSDTFDAMQANISDFRQGFDYVENASGLAVAVGDEVVSIDLFDSPATCAKVWDRVLSGVMLEALEVRQSQKAPEISDVEAVLNRLDGSSWLPAPTIGDGQELRAEPDPLTHASALVYQDTLLHGSVLVGDANFWQER